MLDSKTIMYAHLPPLQKQFAAMGPTFMSSYALQKLLDDYAFDTVLDIGCGQGLHAEVFAMYGKKVTGVDFGRSEYFLRNTHERGFELITGDFNEAELDKQYDCIWCSHVLEHQLNPNQFLKKVAASARPNGIICITVPPLKEEIVGGHVSLWNAGLVLYHLVMAGINCKDAAILKYGYNISVIVRNTPITLPNDLSFDVGDLEKLADYFPSFVHQGFNGDILIHNWTAS
ncbi:class I SAM-dependent methyltransferase [Obesumbacterium proteus]|uniref:class I SAM-dependent methyltransferase n=1 Tax=Obesumbacterium proteus TaxID=82983 RepID=UPI0024328B4B|nr:class I SAM-dependent methyltransferase [Obesumbacterium proteus]